MIPKHLALTALVCLAATASSQAVLTAFQSGATLHPGNTLSGDISTAIWAPLNASSISGLTGTFGAHNSTAAWTNSLTANSGANNSAYSLSKLGGYGYFASGSLHQGAQTNDILPGGNFTITSTAISGLETVLFQIAATDRNGSVFEVLPTLKIGDVVVGEAEFSTLFHKVINPSGSTSRPQDLDSYAFQWDVRDLNLEGGEALTISWTGLVNSGIYELQVNQGNTFVQVVPEPSVALLSGLAGLALFRRRRA